MTHGLLQSCRYQNVSKSDRNDLIFSLQTPTVRMVAVNPNYRGQGIAKALTKMCIDFAKQNNEKIIALHTSEFMDAARHIYENIGFKVLEEIPPLFGKKYWLYTLDLN